MSLKPTFFLVTLFLCFSCLALEAAEERFPRPEFTRGYQLPASTQPYQVMQRNPFIALFSLLAVLGLTGYALYSQRSRNALRVLGLFSLVYFGFIYKGCICAVGSIQNVARALVDLSAPVTLPVIVVFFVPLLTALYWGRLFCGAACPFGVLQDLVILHPVRVNPIIDRCLKLLPFIYLGLALVFTLCGMGFIICEYDPFVGFFRFSGNLSMFIFGAFFLLCGIFIARPYCRYLCPYSVLLMLASSLSDRRVETSPDHCVNCQLCEDACPVGAIVKPRPEAYAETKEQAIKRLQWLIALVPVFLAVGLYTGSSLGASLSYLQPDIKLYRGVVSKDLNDDAVTAFYANDGNVKKLRLRARALTTRLQFAFAVFGIYLALLFIGAAIVATSRRSNKFYIVEPVNCLACGRCYSWCPGKKVTS
ncbi:4Fe-4S binding protein [Candidatus Riflebacteria bacterium]